MQRFFIIALPTWTTLTSFKRLRARLMTCGQISSSLRLRTMRFAAGTSRTKSRRWFAHTVGPNVAARRCAAMSQADRQSFAGMFLRNAPVSYWQQWSA